MLKSPLGCSACWKTPSDYIKIGKLLIVSFVGFMTKILYPCHIILNQVLEHSMNESTVIQCQVSFSNRD